MPARIRLDRQDFDREPPDFWSGSFGAWPWGDKTVTLLEVYRTDTKEFRGRDFVMTFLTRRLGQEGILHVYNEMVRHHAGNVKANCLRALAGSARLGQAKRLFHDALWQLDLSDYRACQLGQALDDPDPATVVSCLNGLLWCAGAMAIVVVEASRWVNRRHWDFLETVLEALWREASKRQRFR